MADRRDRPARADICVLGLRGFPDVLGGVETHCEQILVRLSRQSAHRFVVLGRQGYGARRVLNERLEVFPVAAVRNKYLEALPNALVATLYARLALRPRLLHIHAIGPALVTPLAKLLGLRVVVTHHGRDYNRAKWNWLGRMALRLGESAALRFADEIIAVSPSLCADLRRQHPARANRIHFIPNGAEPAPARTPADDHVRALGLTPGRYVLSAGRLVPEKRFEDLISAFSAAPHDLKLVIAGAADHNDACVRELLERQSPRIIFAGRQNRNQLSALYAHAALFVLPSSHEGLPIVALEALAAGAPVLLSDIQPNLDLGLPAKHYFPMGNIRALAHRLHEPTEMLRVDSASVLSAFDWDHIAAQTAQVYEAALMRAERTPAPDVAPA